MDKRKLDGFWIKIKNLPFNAIALFPFILYTHIRTERLDQHETIHLYQQLEMLIVPFYIWYLIEWCYRRIKTSNWHEAYMNISFEREAYKNESVKNYLNKRRLFSWVKYMAP